MIRTIIKRKLPIVLMLLMAFNASAQNARDPKMQWFADAKLGIFIHWGIYAVNGISESWAFFNNYTPHELYMKQLDGFNASKYDPAAWANLIKESGAKYAVITSKHHDGVSLWNTKAPGATTILTHSKAKRDVLSPFITALKSTGLKTGIYYSLPDWSYQNYDVFTRDRKRYAIKDEPQRWKTFLNYYQQQLDEISVNYRPDLIWFDGNWEHNNTEWEAQKTRELLQKYNPNIIINSRLDEHGDYETPEQGVPVLKPAANYWELCYTMNDSWGYQPFDTKYKSSNMIIRTLVDCISMGGNLLLDIGPKADGTIPDQQVQILKDLGRWTKKHAAAIYGTQAGIPAGHVNAKTALSKDKKDLFIYLDYQENAGIALRGIGSKIVEANVVGYKGAGLSYKSSGNDGYLLKVLPAAYDKDVTVLHLRFNEPLKTSNPTESAAKVIEMPTDEAWLTKHAEILDHTLPGIPSGHYQGNTLLSADRQTLYLFVEGKPTGPITLKGIKNNISRIRVVGEGTILPYEIYNKLYWSKIPGIVYIPVPEIKLDKQLTVIAVLLDAPIDLYREKVGAIESNM